MLHNKLFKAVEDSYVPTAEEQQTVRRRLFF